MSHDSAPPAAAAQDWRPGAMIFAVYTTSWVVIDITTYANLASFREHLLLMSPSYAGVVAAPATLTAWCMLSRAPARVRWPVLLFGGAAITLSKSALLGWEQPPPFQEEATLAGAAIVLIQFAVTACAILVARSLRETGPAQPEQPQESEDLEEATADVWRFKVRDLLLWTVLAAIFAMVARTFYPPGTWDFGSIEWRLISSRVIEVAVCAALATPCAWLPLAKKVNGCGWLLLLASLPLIVVVSSWSPAIVLEVSVLYLSLRPLRMMDIRLLPPHGDAA